MEKTNGSASVEQRPFTLKKWNALAMWSWDVECDTCAICRVHLMGHSFTIQVLYWRNYLCVANTYSTTLHISDACLRCQSENKQDDCVVVWGECNHSFHNCCMALWVKQNNRCPLCQQVILQGFSFLNF